jgi:hypothetical protein
MSVVTVQKPFEEIETLVRDAAPEKLWILGCGKCGKVSGTSDTLLVQFQKFL